MSKGVINLQASISRNDIQQAKYNLEVNQRLNQLSQASQEVLHESKTSLAMTRKLRGQISQSFEMTRVIAADVKKILVLLQTFSKDVLEKVAAYV